MITGVDHLPGGLSGGLEAGQHEPPGRRDARPCAIHVCFERSWQSRSDRQCTVTSQTGAVRGPRSSAVHPCPVTKWRTFTTSLVHHAHPYYREPHSPPNPSGGSYPHISIHSTVGPIGRGGTTRTAPGNPHRR